MDTEDNRLVWLANAMGVQPERLSWSGEDVFVDKVIRLGYFPGGQKGFSTTFFRENPVRRGQYNLYRRMSEIAGAAIPYVQFRESGVQIKTAPTFEVCEPQYDMVIVFKEGRVCYMRDQRLASEADAAVARRNELRNKKTASSAQENEA